MQQQTPPEQFDLAGMAADLNSLLRLKTTVIGIKMFAAVEDMMAIPKIRRPSAVHTTDQIVSMASRLGWTVGITGDDLVGAQCRAVIGLAPQDEKWLAGESYVGVWHGTAEDARKRQEALDVVPFGRYQAMVASPLTSGRLNPPDICLVYATPGQMIILINGLQYTGYKKFEWGVVGETACADSWGRALKTGEPSLSLPCFAERRYGGVPDEEMLMALPPAHLAKAIAGMKQLARNGLRYPIAPYGIQADVRAGMGVPTRRNSNPHRHCEERGDETIHVATAEGLLDCFASLAMTEPQEVHPGNRKICLRRNSTSSSTAPPALPASSSPNISPRTTRATAI